MICFSASRIMASLSMLPSTNLASTELISWAPHHSLRRHTSTRDFQPMVRSTAAHLAYISECVTDICRVPGMDNPEADALSSSTIDATSRSRTIP